MLRALPLVSRAEETAALRAAAPGERGCIRGEGCAALRLPRGHLPPRFKHFTQCVVCLRAQALDVWLSNLVAEEKVHAQEFRNIIGEGEYSAEACIQPCTRGYDGITDPIVRFCPLRLIWEGTRLKQKNVDFVLVPSLRHEPRPPGCVWLDNGFPDAFAEFMRAGVLAAASPSALRGIAGSMYRALFVKAPELDLASSWINLLFDKSFAETPLNQKTAALAVREHVIWIAESNPVFERHLLELHPRWNEFVAETCSQARRVRFLGLDPEFVEFGGHRRRFLDVLKPAGAPRALRTFPVPLHWIPPARGDQTDQLICDTCGEFKGFVNKASRRAKAKKLKTASSGFDLFGQRNVSFEMDGETLKCFRKKTSGRNGVSKLCPGTLKSVRVAGHALEIQGVLFLQCWRCGLLCMRSEIKNAFECGLCAEPEPTRCMVCPVSKRDMPDVRVFENGGLTGVRVEHLCAKHAELVDARQIWHKRHLLDVLKERAGVEANRRYVPALKHG